MVQEEINILYLHLKKTDLQVARMRVLKLMPILTHFLKQGNIYSYEFTPPNSAILWDKHIQTTTGAEDLTSDTCFNLFLQCFEVFIIQVFHLLFRVITWYLILFESFVERCCFPDFFLIPFVPSV